MIIWFFAFAIFRFIRNFGKEVSEDTPWVNSFGILKFLLFFAIVGIISGFLFGTYEYFFNKLFYRKTSFGLTVVIGALGYIGVIIVLLTSFFVGVNTLFDSQLTSEDFKKYIFEGGGFVSIFYCLFVGFCIEFMKQVDKKFGPGNLKRMIFGKFYEPQEEERIFMFLDMRSSTTIAEKLGHIRFSQLIQDCFKDIDAVIPFKTEIYQYVGDEAVLTWEKEKGLKNNNCIHAFYAYMDRLQSRQAYYQSKYGLIPEFKAGINIGLVTVAEVGDIKREIAYHGDTLNTAARIQSKCNEYGQSLLASQKLIDVLPSDSQFSMKQVGIQLLRGKEEKVSIYAIQQC